MKKQNVSTIETKIDKRLEKIENLLKIMDQKNLNTEKRLGLRISAETIRSREQIERTFEAQFQVAIKDFGSRLEDMENRLNERITNVADLITIALTKQFYGLQKRVKRLEQVQQTA